MTHRSTLRAATALALLALASGAAGCMRPRPVGHFGENAFYLSRAHYRIRYLDGRALAPSDWRLTSYELDDDGRPVGARQDARFWTTYDQAELLGASRTRPVVAERFDLFFEHEDGRSVMWARTIPIRRIWEREPAWRLLRAGVLGVDARSGPVPDLIGIGASEPRALGGEPEVRPARVDGQRTHAYTFDLVRGAPPAARLWRVTVVGLRTFRPTWAIGRRRLDSFIVLGYATPPDAHDEHRPAFESLVRRLDLRR